MKGIMGYTRHPASEVWPNLTSEEFASLRESIRTDGQRDPIEATPDKVVFDGWHRLRICEQLKIEPVVVVSDLTPAQIAKRVNGKHGGRRHLTLQELTRHTVKTLRACGLEFAGKGDRRNPQQTRQVGGSAPSDANSAQSITAEGVADGANVSKRTAERAIKDVKKEEEDAKRTEEERAKAEADAIKKKAEKEATKRARKAANKTEADDEIEFWKETAEGVHAELAAVESELAALLHKAHEAEEHEDHETLRQEAEEDEDHESLRQEIILEDMSRANKRLASQLQDLQRKLNLEREARKKAEAQVAFWKNYSSEIESALQQRLLEG